MLIFNSHLLFIPNDFLHNWITATEQNSRGFEMERSADGHSWKNIDTTHSKAENGNSSSLIDYSFTDNNPFDALNFYRLKHVDVDGKFEYSQVLSVDFDGRSAIEVYPNPTSEEFIIKGLAGDEAIRIYDINGREVKKLKIKNATIKISTDELINGVYQIRIFSPNGKSVSKKLVKAK